MPRVRTFEIVFFARMFGPLVITTSCGSEPVQRNRTVSPDLTDSDFGPNEVFGPTLTVFVAANAGTATAATPTAAIATSKAMRRFIAGVEPPVSVGEECLRPFERRRAMLPASP